MPRKTQAALQAHAAIRDHPMRCNAADRTHFRGINLGVNLSRAASGWQTLSKTASDHRHVCLSLLCSSTLCSTSQVAAMFQDTFAIAGEFDAGYQFRRGLEFKLHVSRKTLIDDSVRRRAARAQLNALRTTAGAADHGWLGRPPRLSVHFPHSM